MAYLNVTSDLRANLKEIIAQNQSIKCFLAGSLSGTCSTLLFQPLDLVKTRMQSASAPTSSLQIHRMRMLPILLNVVKNDKIIGLWRGTIPSLARCVPGVGLYFTTLNFLQSRFCDKKIPPKPHEAFLLGLSARSIAGTILLPFTMIKTRFESGQFMYKSISQALIFTYNAEGFRGLFRGLLPTLLRDAPFSSFYYTFYTQLKESTKDKSELVIFTSNESLRIFSCGSIAGVAASVLTHPADVIKTKMQLNTSIKKYDSIKSTVRLIYCEDGARGFFNGITPRLIRRTLMASLAWTLYESMFKNLGLK